ncbi:MAG: ATP synthase F0 subunit C [Planctomycetes bacterium]|nr:ATP synthase F0 subunit C [Planctomycetota bacterium]
MLITAVSFLVLSNVVFSSATTDQNQSSAVAIQGHTEGSAKTSDSPNFYITTLTIGFALAFAAMFGALGQSKAISASVEAIARQPEAGGRIFLAMIIGLALIETLVIYTLVICFMLIGKLP